MTKSADLKFDRKRSPHLVNGPESATICGIESPIQNLSRQGLTAGAI
jgi:hypothetical protein